MSRKWLTDSALLLENQTTRIIFKNKQLPLLDRDRKMAIDPVMLAASITADLKQKCNFWKIWITGGNEWRGGEGAKEWGLQWSLSKDTFQHNETGAREKQEHFVGMQNDSGQLLLRKQAPFP